MESHRQLFNPDWGSSVWRFDGKSWLNTSGGMTHADIQRHLPQISDQSIVTGDKKETLHDLFSHLHHRQFMEDDEASSLYMDPGVDLHSQIPHLNSKNWLASDSSSRKDSIESLSGMPPGTFVIRPKVMESNGVPLSDHDDEVVHTHTLDILSSKGLLHIRIFKAASSGYGFAEPYHYSSVSELVLFYTSNSLNRHNRSLPADLKLEHPLLFLKKTT